VEVATPDALIPPINPADCLLQIKYDGIWAKVVILDDIATVYSKTGEYKKSFTIGRTLPITSRQPIVLIGEFMFGSQWSKQRDLSGKLFIFDCLLREGEDLSQLPYKRRYVTANSICQELGEPFFIVPCYSLSKLGEFWIQLRDSYEGIIVRSWSSTWTAVLQKLKFTVEDDFIITGWVEGKGKHQGRLGAFELSQYDENGKLVKVMNCGGGFTDEMRDYFWGRRELTLFTVCLVSGKGRFHDGSLRNPNFERLRDDKLTTDCTLKRQSR